MHSSAVLALLGATLALASPVHQGLHARHEKRALVYDIVTDIVYVTVTEGALPTYSPIANTTVVVSHTVYVSPVPATTSTCSKSSSTSHPPPPPPKTTAHPPPPPPAPVYSNAPSPPPPAAPIPAPVVYTMQAAPPPPQAPQQQAAPAVAQSPVIAAVVDNHNTCRSSHSAPAMTHNATLAQYAANTASSCVFAHDMSQGGGGYGQNIAAQGSSDPNAWTSATAVQNAIVDEWYSEESQFNAYGQGAPSGESFLHFTQVVWVSSTDVGCAVQACPMSNSIFPGDYVWFTVCNYYPAGNVEGDFASNVLQ